MKSATRRADRTAMDAAGRLVLPKAIRQLAGFVPGQPLEVHVRDGRVEIEPAPLEIEIVMGQDGLPLAVPKRPVPTLSAEEVRNTLERIREGRD